MRPLHPIILAVCLMAGAVPLGADLEGKVAKRALEEKAAYEKAYAAAVGAKRDLRWLDFLRDQILRADQDGEQRRLLALAESGQRILNRDLKQMARIDVDSVLQGKNRKLEGELAAWRNYKLKPGVIADLSDFSTRLADVGKKPEALAVLEEAERHMETQKVQIATVEKWSREAKELYEKAKRAGKDVNEVDVLAAKAGGCAGDVPALYDLSREVRSLLLKLNGLPEEKEEGGGDKPGSAGPKPDDKDVVFRSEDFNFEVRKPPFTAWVFNRKDEGGCVLEIKNDAELAFAEIRAWEEGNASLEDLARRLQDEMQKWIRNYQETGVQKTKLDGKSALQYTFTFQWKDDQSDTVLSGKRVYCRKSNIMYLLAWFTPTGKLVSTQKPLDEIIASFRFK
ncbi:MAG: hypothetical protein HYY93_05170 [Planctomycetes bacterium]|nr:hypothetical protein [Planctomycetota bacterium]